jgi:hypothetical protein
MSISPMRSILAIALAALLGSAESSPAAAQQLQNEAGEVLELEQPKDLPIGHGHFAKLSPEREELFLKTLYGGLKYQPPPVIEPPADPDHKYIWQGNKTKISTELENVVVRFYRKGEREKPAYEVNLKLGDTMFLIKHSLVVNPKMLHGVEMRVLGVFSQNKTRKFMMEGQDRTSMVFMVPPFIDQSETRGLLMCPRDIPVSTEKGDPMAFADTEYEIGDVEFGGVSAYGEAKLLSGVSPGYARVSIFTSGNVPRAINYADETYVKDPNVSINYSPFVEEKLEKIKDPNHITAGIRVQVDQQLPSGFKKTSVSWSSFWIKMVHFDQSFKLTQPIRRFYDTAFEKILPAYAISKDRAGDVGRVGVEVAVGPGRCFIVLRETYPVVNTYTREPLSVPEHLLENARLAEQDG